MIPWMLLLLFLCVQSIPMPPHNEEGSSMDAPTVSDYFCDGGNCEKVLKAFLNTRQYKDFKTALFSNDIRSTLSDDQMSDMLSLAAETAPGLFDDDMIEFVLENKDRFNGKALQVTLISMMNGFHFSKVSKLFGSEPIMSKISTDALSLAMTSYLKYLNDGKKRPDTTLIHSLMMPHMIQRVDPMHWERCAFASLKREDYRLAMEMMQQDHIKYVIKGRLANIMKLLVTRGDLPSEFVGFLIKLYSDSISVKTWSKLFSKLIKSKNYDSAELIAQQDHLWERLPSKTQWKVADVHQASGYAALMSRLENLKVLV